MWHLSAWHKGHYFVYKEAKKAYEQASFLLAQTVYKAYLASDGADSALDDLLCRHGIDPTLPVTGPAVPAKVPPTSLYGPSSDTPNITFGDTNTHRRKKIRFKWGFWRGW